MSIKEQIDQNLKQAMLAGDKTLVTTLRGLKSVILYAEVAKGSRDEGLSDDEIITLFSKEAKKRQESADLYIQGGNKDKADAELQEKIVIQEYLPEQVSEEKLKTIVDEVVASMGEVTQAQMGQILSQVKQKAGPGADGGMIARLVKEKLQ